MSLNAEQRRLYKEWSQLVNMTAGQLKKFANSPEGKEAGLSKSKAKGLGIKSGRESAEWIIRMKSRSASSWTDEMWDWAKRQVAFIKRMSGVKGDLYEDDGVTKTRKHTALLVWGHNPLKTKKLKLGGNIAQRTYASEGGGKADLDKLKKAKRLNAIDVDREYIRNGTGWFQNPYDKKWRYEINDSKMEWSLSDDDFYQGFLYSLDDQNKIPSIKLGDLIIHDELFANYPFLRDIDVNLISSKLNKAWVSVKEDEISIYLNLFKILFNETEKRNFIPVQQTVIERRDSNKSESLRGILLHEIQHIIQEYEDLARGTSIKGEINRIKSGRAKGFGLVNEDNINDVARRLTYLSAGELESNDVYIRRNLSNEERSERPPFNWVEYDTEEIIVDFNSPFKTGAKKLEKGGNVDDWYKNGLEKLRQTDDYKKRQAISHFIHTSKDIIKTDYFMLVPTKPEHAKEYGIESKRPLFLKRLFIPEEKRLNGEGKKALEEIDKIASEGGYDIVFGYIDQKAKFSKDNRENYFNDVDLIKYFLFDNGYAVNSLTNDFHKVINPEKLKSGGDLQDSKENSNLAISKTDIENVIQGKNIPKQSLFIYQAIDKLRKNASSIINDEENFDIKKEEEYFKLMAENDDLEVKDRFFFEKDKNTRSKSHSNQLQGGKGDNMTATKLAKKHGVSLDVIIKGINKGLKVESEHTKDPDIIKEIVADHLTESPYYYDELEKMEKKLDRDQELRDALAGLELMAKNLSGDSKKEIQDAISGLKLMMKKKYAQGGEVSRFKGIGDGLRRRNVLKNKSKEELLSKGFVFDDLTDAYGKVVNSDKWDESEESFDNFKFYTKKIGKGSYRRAIIDNDGNDYYLTTFRQYAQGGQIKFEPIQTPLS